MSLNQIITSLNADGHVDVPAGWTQGRALFGGLLAAHEPKADQDHCDQIEPKDCRIKQAEGNRHDEILMVRRNGERKQRQYNGGWNVCKDSSPPWAQSRKPAAVREAQKRGGETPGRSVLSDSSRYGNA